MTIITIELQSIHGISTQCHMAEHIDWKKIMSVMNEDVKYLIHVLQV